jgi:glutamate synthase (NADPH/NADH) large chain
MIGVHMGKGELYHDVELKDKMSGALPFGDWVGKINELDEQLGAVTEAPIYQGAELR